MTSFRRWWKFYLVGAAGVPVQLAVLALLNRCAPGNYLYTSAVAVEITVLHNFVWHLHYTWRDRRKPGRWRGQLVRFHLSNGLVSLLGNLLLMRILVQTAHLRILIANGLAILISSLLNFWLGNTWAFAGEMDGMGPGTEASGQSSHVAVKRRSMA